MILLSDLCVKQAMVLSGVNSCLKEGTSFRKLSSLTGGELKKKCKIKKINDRDYNVTFDVSG